MGTKKMKINQKRPIKKSVIIIAALVILLLGAGTYFALAWSNAPEPNRSSGTINDPTPPTDEEKTSGDIKKDEIIEQQNNTSETGNTAKVVITDANTYAEPDGSSVVEVRAFISNRIDKTGTCTATITKGSEVVTRTKASTPDASTTQCGTFSFPRSEFNETGTWNVTVSYNSGSANGSAETRVEIR